MREITDEEVLSAEMRITVEQYLRVVDRIENTVIAFLETSDKSDELEEVKQKFKTIFQVIRLGCFDGFKEALIKGTASYDAKIN